MPLVLNCGLRYKDYNYAPTYPTPLFVKHLLWITLDQATGVYHGASPFPKHPIEVWMWPLVYPRHWNFNMQIHISPTYAPHMPFDDFFLSFYPDIDSRWNTYSIMALERHAGARIMM